MIVGNRGIVWLASYPKSGNTWVRAFLYALIRLQRGDSVESIDINNMDDFRRSDLTADLYRPFLSGPIAQVDRREIAAARPKVQAKIAGEAKGLVLVKTHNARISDREYPLVNLAASVGAVYILRNPLDVVVSFAAFAGISIDASIDALATPYYGQDLTETQVFTIFDTWSQHVASWTLPRHAAVHVVRYEDLIERPSEAFRAIATHLLMQPTSPQLEEAIALSSFDRLKDAEGKSGFNENADTASVFFRKGQPNQWQTVLSATQVDRVVKEHGVQMERFGYLPD
jgi:hypothetical protein